VTDATVCNHKVRHEGDWDLFVGGPFESLCKAHHDSDVQAEERKAARERRTGGVGQSRGR
jgi:5-methylcytosine-specific restriction protein A